MLFRFLILLFIFPLSVFSQSTLTGKITGTVYDSITDNPLQYASVSIDRQSPARVCDKNGKFIFEQVPVGNNLIKISYIGYKELIKIVEVKTGQTLRLKIKLVDTVLAGIEVEIVANRTGGEFEQASRVNIIPLQRIENAPVQNISELLDYIPGVNTNNTFGFFSSKAIVSMRGLPGNDQSRTLVILDGVPLNKTDEGSVNWNMINKNDIQSIKIIKGPGPAMYGSGAMGGVIELTSKTPKKRIEGNQIISYGTYNTLTANTSFSGIIKDSKANHSFYWGINGFGRMSDGYITEPEQYRTEEDTILEPVYVKEINTTVKAGYTYKKNQQADIQFSYYDDIRGSGVKVFEKYGANSSHETFYGMGKYSGYYKDFHLNLNFYFINENYKRLYEYLSEGEYKLYAADSKRKDKGVNINLSYSGIKHQQIYAGINYKGGSVSGADTYYTSTDIIYNAGKMETFAIYLQDELNFFKEKLQVNIGLRYDIARFHDGLFKIEYPSYTIAFYSEFNDTLMTEKSWKALCPRFSLQYKFTNSIRSYFSIARGFRAPILDDMCRTGKRKGTFSVANPALNPELLTSVEWGGDAELVSGLAAGLSLYYSIGKEFMYYVSTGDSVNMGYKISPIIKKKNIGEVELYGGEFELKYEYKDILSLFANYSYTHAQIKEYTITDQNVDIDLTGKYLTDIPSHKVSAGITWNNIVVKTTLLFKYIGKAWINDQNTIEPDYLKTDRYDDYTTFSIRLERKIIRGLHVSFSIENIFNKIYITSDVQQCPGVFMTGAVRYSF